MIEMVGMWLLVCVIVLLLNVWVYVMLVVDVVFVVGLWGMFVKFVCGGLCFDFECWLV